MGNDNDVEVDADKAACPPTPRFPPTCVVTPNVTTWGEGSTGGRGVRYTARSSHTQSFQALVGEVTCREIVNEG